MTVGDVGQRHRAVLRGAVRAATAAVLLLLVAGCIPIGVRVQNMLGSALG